MNNTESSAFSSDDAEPPGSPLRVLVANDTSFHVDEASIRRAVDVALSTSPFSDGVVSVAVVDDPTIRRLNQQYLQHDYATDVLSFALDAEPPRLEGEVIVSADTAQRWAVEAAWSAEQELLLYVVHGTLHLAGYGDKTSEEAARMRAAEREVLERLGVAVSPTDSRWRATAVAQDESGGRS